jgi:NAD(P)-dependent dehydrogenase (short-subunit alcohol dehydrogenase family)
VKRRIPLGRLGDAAECAGWAVLLCSPAGAFITRADLYVDGGMDVQ